MPKIKKENIRICFDINFFKKSKFLYLKGRKNKQMAQNDTIIRNEKLPSGVIYNLNIRQLHQKTHLISLL